MGFKKPVDGEEKRKQQHDDLTNEAASRQASSELMNSSVSLSVCVHADSSGGKGHLHLFARKQLLSCMRLGKANKQHSHCQLYLSIRDHFYVFFCVFLFITCCFLKITAVTSGEGRVNEKKIDHGVSLTSLFYKEVERGNNVGKPGELRKSF